MTIALIATVVAIAIILLAPNTITITNAQQQQQPPLNSQPPALTQNRTTIFQSTEDGVRLSVPQGWVIHDVNNTGSILSEESVQGYAILAQLCPQEEEQAALSNVSGRGNTTTGCQGSEGNIIHVVRYPDLDTRLFANNATTTTANNSMITTTDNILTYHLQKLQEVGYRSMQIVNSTDMTLNVTNAQTNQTIATVPGQFVEMTYNTASSPNETREGYFILTATNATRPNVGMTKGYSVFYEGGNSSTAAATADTTTSSGSLALGPLAAPVREVFDSFELVALVAPTEQPLTVEISSNDTEAIAPATFEFEADVGGGTEPYTYSWDFDDESSDESDEQTVSHTFEEAGSYNVSLTVTDSGSQSASDSVEITVEEEEEVEEPPAEEEVEEEEPIPLLPPPPVEEEEEEEEPIPPSPPADDVAENIEDEVDAFVQELLDRFGVENPGLP
ncbi:MAG: PKD domain-containing protein [Thermoproteota archaeon]|nr:PKD domain-containing protein [Thermoproteota archaeon]